MQPSSTGTAPNIANSGQAMQQLQQAQSSAQSPEQMLQKAQQSLGTTAAQQQVQGLQGAISNTTRLLNNVAPSVMGRTGNSLVTSAQANAQINNEQAPISQELNQQSQDYNQANSNYTNLEQQAENLANSDASAQQNKLGYLQNIYSALYGQEQNQAQRDEQARQFNADFAERQREFGLSGGGSGGINPTFGSMGGGSLGGSTTQNGGLPQAVTKSADGHFSFTNPTNGGVINALQYAQATGYKGGFRGLLSTMAQAGDNGAKAALNFVGNDGNADPRKITSPALAGLYHALTGKYVAVYKQPANYNIFTDQGAANAHKAIVNSVRSFNPRGILGAIGGGSNSKAQAQFKKQFGR